MESFDELMHKQSTTINSVTRAISNFKKLGQAKMTYAVTKIRMETLKEKFEQCCDLDAKLNARADPKEKNTHPYFTDRVFTEC